MKGTTVIFVLLSLLLCWQHVDSMKINFIRKYVKDSIQLSMAEESVDDMYFGCNDTMQKEVNRRYLKKEMGIEPFHKHWKRAEKCAEKKLHLGELEGLTKAHLQAICAYTGNGFYEKFSEAVRTGKKSYRSSFRFHSLHFLLTSALQTLNNNYACHTTVRRSGLKFIGAVNQRFRFGSFASSSTNPNLTTFGNETCFLVETCAGALIQKFSVYFAEAEVLIPPYEVFIIRKKIDNKNQMKALGVQSCEVLYVLESAGCKSELNCKLLHK